MSKINYFNDALDYIAKIADGGMRDAITLLDKCLAYSTDLTLENVVKAIGTTDYDTMFSLTNAFFKKSAGDVIKHIESIHSAGKDLKLFVKSYLDFILDVNKYDVCGKSFDCINIPSLYTDELSSYGDYEFTVCHNLLATLVKLNADIKWDVAPKYTIEATLMLECNNDGNY